MDKDLIPSYLKEVEADDNVMALNKDWADGFKNFDDIIWEKKRKNGRDYYEPRGEMYKPTRQVCSGTEECKAEMLSDTNKNYVKVALINRLKMDWYILHKMTLNYPEIADYDAQEKAFRKLHAFSWLLPCSICQRNFRKKMEIHPPRLGG